MERVDSVSYTHLPTRPTLYRKILNSFRDKDRKRIKKKERMKNLKKFNGRMTQPISWGCVYNKYDVLTRNMTFHNLIYIKSDIFTKNGRENKMAYGLLKDNRIQGKTLRGKKTNLSLIHIYWRGIWHQNNHYRSRLQLLLHKDSRVEPTTLHPRNLPEYTIKAGSCFQNKLWQKPWRYFLPKRPP